MKKLKLIMPIVATSFVASVAPIAITSCSCASDTKQVSTVELSKEVIAKGVSLNTFNIEQNKYSTIVLNLPDSSTISGITLKLGTTTLHAYDVIVAGNKISIPASKMTAVNVVISTITLEKQPEPEPEPIVPIDFASCSWSDIDKICQQLELGLIDESKFCQHFKIDGKTISSIDELLELERTIKINGVDHIIRVIGVSHDTIAQEGELNGKKAALTFELKTLLSDSNGNALKSVINPKPFNYDYPNYIFRANLCGKGSGTKTWDKTALEMLEDQDTGCPELLDVIKTTSQTIATATVTWGSETVQTEYCDKLFCPTYYNLTTTQTYRCAETLNTTYKFYKNKQEVSEEELNTSRIKTDANGNNEWYWLASAYAYTENGIWKIKEDGALIKYGCQEAGAVTFAFCI